MTGVNYIALAIPVFFALIGVEWLISRWQHREVYRLNDSISDLHTGILQQTLGVFTKTIVFGVYVLLYETVKLVEIPGAWWAWVACFLLVDHQYYWFHRISHESNLPWGAHIVHHSSEEFNLAVALRQGAFQPLFSWVFYLPLAWLGFGPLMFLACSSFNTLYQFWIHTRLIDRLGPIEWVFNTPSHHRVHHGCDDKYLDKNYAGTLIIWDRLYGSFQPEEEEPTYGITKPLASWNPLWANVHYYSDLARLARQAPNWRERLKVWLKPPAWKPDWAPEGPGARPEVSPLSHGDQGKYDVRAPKGLVSYILVQFVVTTLLTVGLLFAGAQMPVWQQVAVGVLIAWSCGNLGGMFEARSWVLLSELARLASVALLAVGLSRSLDLLVPVGGSVDAATLATAAGAVVYFGAFAAWLLRYKNCFRTRAERPATLRPA